MTGRWLQQLVSDGEEVVRGQAIPGILKLLRAVRFSAIFKALDICSLQNCTRT